MSNNIEKKKFPWWIKLLIIVSALPVLTLPMIIGKSSAIQYDGAKMFFMFYPFYNKQKTAGVPLLPLPLFLLDADSPGTNRVVVKELTDNPTDQSFYL